MLQRVPLFLSVLQRVPLFAFTNSNPTHQSVWGTKFAQELSPFRRIFVSSELGLRIPDHEAYEAVAELAGYPTSACLFFDDTTENVEGALGAGMQAVHVTGPEDVRASFESWS